MTSAEFNKQVVDEIAANASSSRRRGSVTERALR